MPRDPRSSPSGPSNAPLVARSIGNALSAQFSMTLVPAGHEPGLWLVGSDFVNRVAPGAGTIVRSFTWSAPLFGAVSVSGSATPVTQTGHAGGTGYPSLTLVSDGTASIVAIFTPGSITGSPVMDVYATATLIGRLQ